MTPADLVEELDVLADGSRAVVVKRVIRRRRRRLVYESHLYVVDLADDRAPRRLTTGVVRDTNPRCSPDGASVVFLRSNPVDDDAPTQLCIVAIDGGRVRVLAPSGRRPGFGAISEVEWSPDGTRLALVAAVDPPRTIIDPRPPIGSAASRLSKVPTPVGRRMTRADWRWDGEGPRDHWSHLFVLEPAGPAAPRQVTQGDWGVSSITWHPKGKRVAFVSDRDDTRDLRPRSTVWAVDVDGRGRRAEPSCVIDAAGGVTRPAYSPNGRWIAGVGVLEPAPLDDVMPTLLLAPADGSRPATALAPDLDRPIGNWADTDLTGWMVAGRTGPVWRDDRTIVAVVTDRGRALPERWTIDRDGRALEVPVAIDRDVAAAWAESITHCVAVRRGRRDVITLGTQGGRGMEVMSVDLDAPPDRRRFQTHTTFGSAWQHRFMTPEMRRVEAPGPGGPIETWVASPPDAGDTALPTIVALHGGPLGAWGPAPHIETIVLVNAGYRVVCPNIRGSAGYGAAWIGPQLGDWGGVDADDVHAALDHTIELGLVDPTRVGVFGLSYGGFMVNWLVGTTDRFGAAVSENGVTNQVSAWANSDGGPDYCRASLLGDPFTPEGVEKLWRQSPLRHVANVHTPLLLLQGEADLRCPAADNEQFFVALRHLGRMVEYVLYPESFHTYAYNGRPDRRIDRMQRVVTWFDTHL
jgi:dipeptidyl aminopeptidase/acylaminoacyl peptidase